MINDLRPYPEYKDSGQHWLGQIPAHWDIRASKRMFKESAERARPDDEQLSATQSHGVILQAEYERIVGRKVVRILNHLDKRKHVEKDDFVISMRSFQGGLERAWCRGAIRSSYVVLNPREGIHVPYFAHLFKSHPYIQALRTTSEFIRDGQDLTFSNFCDVPLPLVPLEEQKAIADYLDANAATVRRFIRNRRRLIEVLNEQKQAIVNRAVTRGLAPNVPLRPSCIDWLGDIPEHWIVAKLTSRYDQCLGKMVDAKRFTGEHAIPYLRNIDVQWDRINTHELPLIDIAPHGRQRFTVRHGDLLVCEGGDVGRCAFWRSQLEVCGFQKALHRLRPLDTNRDYPRFLYYCMFNASKRGVFVADGSENTIAHLTGVKLRAHRFAFPPRDEQQTIAEFLDATMVGLENAVDMAKREIDLIREYRTRLIADVVTGRVDVRDLAPTASLPADEHIDEGIDDEEMQGDDATELVEEAADGET